MKTIWANITNWLEIYFWLPMSLFFVWAAIELHYYMTGRATGEDSWEFVVGMAPRFVAIILSIGLVSVSKEAFGSWLTRDQKLANPIFASISAIVSASLCVFFAWLLSH